MKISLIMIALFSLGKTQWFREFFDGAPYLIKNRANYRGPTGFVNPNYTAYYY